jgi:16S rRNA pseudouridine516 synthase
VTLHRDRIGALDLPADLGVGAYRIMTEEDIAQVFAASGK